jgi:hypothetical protein
MPILRHDGNAALFIFYPDTKLTRVHCVEDFASALKEASMLSAHAAINVTAEL